MNRSHYSSGPQFFGNQVRKSWMEDIRIDSPGPAAYRGNKLHNSNPPQWRLGFQTGRDTFLDKHFYHNPSPDAYKIHKLNQTHHAHPQYSIPEFDERRGRDNPNKIDEGSVGDYKPTTKNTKPKLPQYSLGYYFERDYSSISPSPDAYDFNFHNYKKKDFNRTQHSFNISHRPTPYGQEYLHPGVGAYHVTHSETIGPKYSIGTSDRREIIVGRGSSDAYYELAKDIRQFNHGKTMGHAIEIPKNKDVEDFPAPNKYNAQTPSTVKNIITYDALRSDLGGDKQHAKYPSPQKYDTRPAREKKSVSFTKQRRYEQKFDSNPGVGAYKVEAPFNKTLGNMSIKLKDLTHLITPSPQDYQPKVDITKLSPQRPINYYSDRTDFSKSITGRNVGPGLYTDRQHHSGELGKIGNSLKFQKNRNKNPGPGNYEIPNHFGKLPSYYTAPRKVSTDGYSIHEKNRQEKLRKQQEYQSAFEKKQQAEEAAKEAIKNESQNNESQMMESNGSQVQQ